ncbi:MAG: beta-N-acetylhexosaminidase [Candidatus Latescibacterota bacterium]|nr:beta-N-acetylhexosaminidase [Candidatus Latescibacterota bacterium]
MDEYDLVVDFDLRREVEGELHVRATLHNRSLHDLISWSLKFDLPKSIRAREGTDLVSHIGSHVTLAPTEPLSLAPGRSTDLAFSGDGSMIQRLSDLPRGIYVSCEEENGKSIHLPVSLGEHNLETIATGQVIQTPYGSVNDAAVSAARGQVGSVGAGAGARQAAIPSGSTMADPRYGIVPRPSQLQVTDGSFSRDTSIDCFGPSEAACAIDWLGGSLSLQMTAADQAGAQLRFVVDTDLSHESYRLTIDPAGITIQGADAAGFFNGTASVLQLAERSGDGRILWPCGVIEDTPRFAFRGLMLDCARHFHDKETVLRTLDLMAQFKLNRFHWHLTDDEGWRIEIQAFPELTERGAWRGEGEVLEAQFGTGPNRYGGFYSRQDVQDVIDYAAVRQIQVIPEIDVPGHSRAAIKSCPELLVEEADDSQYCGVQLYTDNVLNPALPGTYQFLHTVLDEVCDLFPGEYVHVGADEVPPGVWEQSPACRDFMAEHGYENAHELQGHLLRDLQEHLAKKGKKLMGWEEAVHGDKLDHSATVNAWGGIPIGTELANAGYGVVACAAPFAYLDLAWDANAYEPGYYWAGTNDLAQCYGYEPGTPELTEEGAAQMIGVQAALWGELVKGRAQLEYMLFPRLLAMAETAWTAAGDKDWEHFVQRLPRQMTRLHAQGVNHRPVDADS